MKEPIDSGEPLVSLSGLTAKLQVYPYYHKLGYSEALPDCYAREGVADRLVKAAERLPEGYSLVVWDGWRPYRLQQAIFDRFRETLLAQGWQEGEALTREVTKYVALPSTDPAHPAPHLTGGAVDVTIAGPNGWLPMGTDFDDFTPLAATDYFEQLPELSAAEMAIRDNRRWLHELMTSAGFVNYPEEWWHFDYGNKAWARHHQTLPKYGGILSLEKAECIE
ncbi:M15 family metallopeptidase [Brevibacillus sp. SYP-B805]|uniref:M15 family metallopeptidase n=1 Tax=Brevibacillus sp. SYP-B805 TaxID=1578199 RepID=UPI003217FD48